MTAQKFCLECAHFKMFFLESVLHCVCCVMKNYGIYSAVEPVNICKKYLSRKGKDIYGNQVNPDELSKMFKIEIRDGEIFIPRQDAA